VHAAYLLPVARHALPAWTLWYLGVAALLGGARTKNVA
jgi:hypothetical protein